MNADLVIAAARRTPIGAFQGMFTPVSATQLGAAAARGALEDAGPLSLIHISEPTRLDLASRMPSSA